MSDEACIKKSSGRGLKKLKLLKGLTKGFFSFIIIYTIYNIRENIRAKE
jgi:hypothetical protein